MKIPFPICFHRTMVVLGLRKARMAVQIRLEALMQERSVGVQIPMQWVEAVDSSATLAARI